MTNKTKAGTNIGNAIEPGTKTQRENFMHEAISLAEKGVGEVSPNPMVGAVVVKEGKIVGRGWHDHYGALHAEAMALKAAGKNARGACLYVTLEPCNHFGKQPPCTKAIIDAGIKKVIIAMPDPNKISGHGAFALKRKGIAVSTGLCRTEAEKQNEFYLKSIAMGRPFIAVKIAMTREGFISYGDGKRKRISCKKALEYVQLLRKRFDAILVGLNTVLKDNPRLTYRPNQKFNPIRVILDSEAKTPPGSKIFLQKGETIIACTKKAAPERIKRLAEKGATIIVSKQQNGVVDLKWLAKALFKCGIQSILVEAGQKTASSFISHGLFDKLLIMVSQRRIKKGLKAFNLKRKTIARVTSTKMLGNDLLIEVANINGT